MRENTAHKSLSVLASVAIVLVALGAVYAYNLDGWLINDDEGSFLYQAWRITEGEQPYRDFFTSRWPLFLYTSAGWMQMAAPNVVPMRAICIVLTLGTALITFLLARETLPVETALLAMFVFLLHPHVFNFGRYFQPEAFYVFFSVLGLYLFSLGERKRNHILLSLAGLVLALGSLYKLLAILVVGGCLLYLAMRWWRKADSRREVILEAVIFLASYAAVFGLVTLLFMARFPSFGKSVIELNLRQEEGSNLPQNLSKGVVFLVRYFLSSVPFLLLGLPAAVGGLKGSRSTELFSWQLPTALAFTVLSRELFPRLLLYLVPSLSILFAASLEPVRRLPNRSLLLLTVIGAVIIPWTLSDVQVLLQEESDTMRVARWIQARTTQDAYVVSDYQELNFYSRRPSTPLGAEISYVVLDSGQINEDDLIRDIEDTEAEMVILDVSPKTAHHLVNIRSYGKFHSYLEESFTLVDVVPRADQRLEIYLRDIKEINSADWGPGL